MYKFYIILLLILSSCTLFVIGEEKPQKEVIDLTQDTPEGTVYLFNRELKENNIPAAAAMLARSSRGRIDAVSQEDYYYDLHRISSIIDNRSVSRMLIDTLADDLRSIKLELDYLKEFEYTVQKFDSTWYILGYEQIKR